MNEPKSGQKIEKTVVSRNKVIALEILCKRRELENLNEYFKRLDVEVLSAKEAYRKITCGVKV